MILFGKKKRKGEVQILCEDTEERDSICDDYDRKDHRIMIMTLRERLHGGEGR
ncbi:MAG: hypothetical protein JEZ08_06060 [Clostridiales bacterium]|nr:hypothetical protein [Clostridiales bacterium]